MNLIERAALSLGVEPNTVSPFREVEPFSGQLIEGAICRKEDHRYGALYLAAVNERPAEQVVYCTPKIGYPFSPTEGDRVYHFPVVDQVDFYEKYDGTNIFAYRFSDSNGQVHIGYKTRLIPVLRSSRWGSWIDLWRLMLDRYPAIAELPLKNECGLSFELFGSSNPHLVAYDEPLDVRLLFGVTNDGRIRSPDSLDHHPVPIARHEARATSHHELVAAYEQLRAAMTARNAGSDTILTEGLVLYCRLGDGTVRQYKCKPEQVEEIHFAIGATINRHVARQACLKAIEAGHDLSEAAARAILAEDWDAHQIDSAGRNGVIARAIEILEQEIAFRDEVLGHYRAIGVSLRDDKRTVMRALAARFPKGRMSAVYSTIALFEGLPITSPRTGPADG